MYDIKNIIGVITVVLTFVGYVPYIIDVLKGKTRPHLFSWFIWCVTTLIIYALQVKAGAGSGSWATLSVGIIIFFVFILGFRNGDRDIKKVDVLFLVLALVALGLWIFVNQPVLSIVLLTAIDIFGFIPTLRKSWSDPYSETLSMYMITTFRHALSIFALVEFNIITSLFPISWTIANGLLVVVLVTQRKNTTKVS
jgi:hypothetical protein